LTAQYQRERKDEVMPKYTVRWPDGHEVTVEAEKIKYARRRAAAKRWHEHGYDTSDDERRALDVDVVRDMDMDACVVKQAADGGWWLVANPQVAGEQALAKSRKIAATCPHCAKRVTISEQLPENLPGRPFVLWEFRERDEAEGLCSMVNTMILMAAMRGAVQDEDEPEAA
jgi:hypothetical protein